MSTFIPSGLLADGRMLMNDALSDSCTNSRTAATVNCMVSAETRQIRVAGLDMLDPLPIWRLTLPDSTDAKPGDTLTVTGKGDYTLIQSTNPVTYSVSTSLYAIGTIAVTASTKRTPGTAVAGPATQIASLTLRHLRGVLLQPMATEQATSVFGSDVSNPAWIWADWQSSFSGDRVITGGDQLTIPTGQVVGGVTLTSPLTYDVRGAKQYPGLHIMVLVEIPA